MTDIGADEQVDYRLRRHAGCGVVESTGAVVEADQAVEADSPDPAVSYRLRSDGVLVWMGAGLDAVGLTEGQVLDHEGEEAARRLMKGCHPKTGARLAGSATSVRAHESATLTVAPLVKEIELAAAEAGVEAEALLDGKPYQQKKLAQQQRMVNRWGEAHRLHVGTLHKLARAAGLDLADIYTEAELTRAWENKDLRTDSRVRGWDLVLDLPKSDSVLAGLMGELDDAEYRRLVHQAKTDTFRQLERWIGYGVGSQDGKPVRLATGGLVGWSVEHRSARPMGDGAPGDPHLHLHVVIANMARCADGKWRSIANSGADLYRHASAADAYFKARVRSLAYERFGVRRTQSALTGAWEVEGIPEPVRDVFSRRSAKVTEELGEGASREDQQRLGALTRRAKHAADPAGMRTSWRERAEAAGVEVDAMVAAAAPGGPGPDGGGAGLAGPGGGPRIPPPADLAAVVFDPETGVTASQKMFTRAELLAAVANALPLGIGAEPAALERLADDVLRVEGYAVALPHIGSTVMSSTDRYTTADVLAAEETVIAQALDRVGDGSARLTVAQAEAAMSVFAVAAGFELSGQQRQVVTRILTEGHGVEAVVGVAGAGKSTLMDACRIAWDATGTTYAGACLSAVGAKGLQDASAIPSRTVASWLQQIEGGRGLTGIDVLVVDEAVMTDDRSAARLLTEAARTGTKVVAIGDPKQLQAVGVGGWFREVHRLVDGEVLTENRRQENEAERAALEVWRTGDHQHALELLAAGGRVHAVATADEARSEMLMTWDELRTAWPDEQDLLQNLVVLAARNIDVDALNLGAQQIRRAAGELGAEQTYALPGGGELSLAEGDVVRVRVNDYRSRRGEGPDVLNGYRAVVTQVAEDRRVEITWRTKDLNPDGSVRTESAWMKPDDIGAGALSLGYAMTVAASQGLTCHTSLLYGHGANAHAVYPGITRAKKANHIWLPLDVVEDERTQKLLGKARTETEQLHRAIGAFARYLGQSSEDGMISDALRPAPESATVPRQVEVERAEAREKAEAPVQEARRVVSARAARMKSPSTEHALRRQAEDEAGRTRTPARAPEPVAGQPEDTGKESGVPDWKERPYGKRPDGELARSISSFLTMAEQYEQKAAEAREAHRALAERLERDRAEGTSRGARWAAEAGAVLDTAVSHLARALEETAAIQRATDQATNARSILRHLEKQREASWLALRLAGSSKKELRQMEERYLGEAIGGDDEAQRARRASDDARLAAWETLKASPHAEALGATGHAPRLDDMAQKLAEMRQALPERAQARDARDARQLGQLHGTAQASTTEAADWRRHAELARAEQQLRHSLAEQHPDFHKAETMARTFHARQVQAQQRQQAPAPQAAAAVAQPQQRRGPSMGR
ncbi:MobF family relaxase [Streptomyces sp. NRRL S-378]|uniref:MobF family relaxase n=1 Tax=Streptomyces sp. NRRL S-378 TaxID=1463904 RepID=UPI000B1514E7|nr:MobF family relaxase [Streptomyces sp. NRRL S-378]